MNVVYKAKKAIKQDGAQNNNHVIEAGPFSQSEEHIEKKFSWFQNLFGFQEEDVDHQKFILKGNKLVYNIGVEAKSFEVGKFLTPTLAASELELETQISSLTEEQLIRFKSQQKSDFTVLTGDCKNFLIENPGSTFQVASQFNGLENATPRVNFTLNTYPADVTQGPAHAVMCAPGTFYRRYLTRVDQDGSAEEIDDSSELSLVSNGPNTNYLETFHNELKESTNEAELKSLERREVELYEILDREDGKITVNLPKDRLFVVHNGYLVTDYTRLQAINETLGNEVTRNQLKKLIRTGIQRDTEIQHFGVGSVEAKDRLVTQVFASAIGVSYHCDKIADETWRQLAELVLEAQYEHTILEGLKNNIRLVRSGDEPKPIILTQLGLGVFGNKKEWVETAMKKAIKSCQKHGIPFEVQINIFEKSSNDVNFVEIATTVENVNKEADKILQQKIDDLEAGKSSPPSSPRDPKTPVKYPIDSTQDYYSAIIGGAVGGVVGGALAVGGLACVSALGTGIVLTAPVSIGIVATGIVVGAVAGVVAGEVLGDGISSKKVQNML